VIVSNTVPNCTISTSTAEVDTPDIPGLTAWPHKNETEPLQGGVEVPDMIACQPWCDHGHEHGRDPLEGQWCLAAERRVSLHLRETEECSSGEWREPYVTVYPTKTFARETSIFLGFGESEGVDMTPGEALLLAHELVHAVGQIKAAAA